MRSKGGDAFVLLTSMLATLAVAGAAMATFADGGRALPDYAAAHLASSWPALAKFLSPDGRGETIWFEAVEVPGFDSPSQASAAYRAQFGFSFSEIAGLLAELVFLGAVFFGAFAIIERRARSRSAPYRVAGLEIPPGRECYHLLICGSPGSGSRPRSRTLLDQIRARGASAIVYDVVGRFHPVSAGAGGDHRRAPRSQASQSPRRGNRRLEGVGVRRKVADFSTDEPRDRHRSTLDRAHPSDHR